MTDYDYEKLTNLDILAEIEKWWKKLPQNEQSITAEYIQQMNREGKSKEWIFVSLDRIKDRAGGIDRWEKLLYYDDYQAETDEIIKDYTDYIEKEAERRRKIIEGINQQIEELKHREVVIIPKRKKKKKAKYSLEDVEEYCRSMD